MNATLHESVITDYMENDMRFNSYKKSLINDFSINKHNINLSTRRTSFITRTGGEKT